MSEFKVEVVRVKVIQHPNADAIEIVKVGDFQSIVRKGIFADGSLACYIPEQAIVPEWMLREMGMYDEDKQKGGLAGSLGNRVKAIKLRGVLSQGLMLAMSQDGDGWAIVSKPSEGEPAFNLRITDRLAEGSDAAEFLGITKYEPSIPSHFGVHNVPKEAGAHLNSTHKYDFDNLKKTPTMFDDGEHVVITEKIHGTFIQVGVVPSQFANEKYYGGRVIVSSKGMGAKGHILDHEDETNLYIQAAKKHGLLDFALNTLGEFANSYGKPTFIMGEVFGKTLSGAGIQDLTYTDESLDFRAFDVCIGNRGNENYLPFYEFTTLLIDAEIPCVPVLYVGPYSKDVVLEHTDGFTTLGPFDPIVPASDGKKKPKQIREGVVVKSYNEVRNPHFGRKIAKSISEAYLLRKSGTEFN